jgi:hypothetical protein
MWRGMVGWNLLLQCSMDAIIWVGARLSRIISAPQQLFEINVF